MRCPRAHPRSAQSPLRSDERRTCLRCLRTANDDDDDGMAGRNRIHQMFNLLDKENDKNNTNFFTKDTQLSPEKQLVSPKPGCSKDFQAESHTQLSPEKQPDSPKPGCLEDFQAEFYIPLSPEKQPDSPKPGCSKDFQAEFHTQLSPEKLPDSPKPGCSKDFQAEFQTVDDLIHHNIENSSEIEEIADNFFTERDESYMTCFDILFNLVDSLPCFYIDYSTDSSDDYVPDTEESSDSDGIGQRSNRENIVIPDSEPEGSFWDKVGVKEGRKRKPRKSEKERRKDRENRKRRRNLGQNYKTNKGKQVKEREFQQLGDCRMKCAVKIPEEFRKKMFEIYWSLGDYGKRVQFISSLIKLQEKKTQKINATINRQVSNKYYLTIQTESYQTCKGCFLKTFNETNKFVQNVAEKLKNNEGLVPDSCRGRHPSANKISDERLEAVKSHILSFPAFESHYGRSKTKKKFLAPHLCLADMYNAYKEVTENPVSETIYSWVFKSQNLSFKKPYLDTCIKCDKLNMEIKACEEEEKAAKIRLKEAHVRNAEGIYDRKTSDKERSIESSETFVAAFDLQQCLPTPYLKSGAVFYKRQLWTFNLTIRNCTTNRSYCFMWHESIAGRGGNEIASCVYNFILHHVPDGMKHLIFYSDSCFGQNKNFYMVVMLLLALRNHPSLQTITHNFFVPGHSHMECDVDHALIEKEKKKTQMDLHHPRDWYQLVRTCGKRRYFTVTEMDRDLFLNFASLLKGPLVQRKIDEDRNKFNISETAIFRYTREDFPKFQHQGYESDQWNTVSLLRKRGKSPMPNNLFETENIPRCYNAPLPISVDKKRDLMFLLPLINSSARSFYEDLPFSENVRDTHPLEPTEHNDV